MNGPRGEIRAIEIANLPEAERIRFVDAFNNGPGYSLHVSQPALKDAYCTGTIWKHCVPVHNVHVRLQDSEKTFRLWEIQHFSQAIAGNKVLR